MRRKRKSEENFEYLIPKQIYEMKIMSDVNKKLKPQFSKIEEFALFNSKIGEPIYITKDSRKIFDENLIKNKFFFHPRYSASTKEKLILNLESPYIKSLRENKTESLKYINLRKRNFLLQGSIKKRIDNLHSINHIIKKCQKLENGSDRASIY